jgi:multiple antibiotic resistance protein
MKETAVTLTGVVDTFLVLLIGVGPKIALVPFLQITAPLPAEVRAQVRRKMLVTAATAAFLLVLFGEVLRILFHFSVGSLSIAGGVILLVLAARMVLEQRGEDEWSTAGSDPMRLAVTPLAVPFLLNPVGIVGLMTISAETGSLGVFAVELAILAFVLALDIVVFRWADQAGEVLNEDRMLVVEKVFGFVIAAVAVQLVIDGLHSLGVIAPTAH